MTIFFVGGGTLGPVMPLLCVARVLKRKRANVKIIWIGTSSGPECDLMKDEGIPFYAIPEAKLTRFFSLSWFTFPFNWLRAKHEAKRLIEKFLPVAIVSMGGFTSVPVVRVASKRGILCFIHQLDLKPGLSNRLVARACTGVTTSFEYERGPFGYHVSDERICTPVRFNDKRLMSMEDARKFFGFDEKKPTILYYGGGTGAKALNNVLELSLVSWLTFAQIIHSTGRGKGFTKNKIEKKKGFYQKEYFSEREMAYAYSLADLVICRAGMGALSEISALKKAAIIVPIPSSHQEINAQAFEEQGAVVVVEQSSRLNDELITSARLLLENDEERKAMGERAHVFLPTDNGSEMAERIEKILFKKDGA